MTLNRPSFDQRPVASVPALARALAVEETKLVRIAARADALYRGPIMRERAGRKPREVFDVQQPLRDIQQRILDRILRAVHCPDYLMGVVKGRGYIDNARRHAGRRVVFGQDVESFYPSISLYRVQRIFQHVFHFPPDVASLLAKLCTRDGALVQGGITSTHLAMLALYRTEPELEENARRNGMTYTRYVDDVHISSPRSVPPAAMTRIVGAMRSSLERHGFRPKREKQFVARPDRGMRVHNLNVSNAVSVPQKRRAQLRAAVFQLERRVETHPWDAAIEREYASLCAGVGQLKHANPGVARSLKQRLVALSPSRAMRESNQLD